MNKKLGNVLAIAFAPATGYTPVVDDIVKISGDWEVNLCDDGDTPVGIVEVVDDYAPTKTVVVRTQFTSLRELTAYAAISAGAAVVPAGSNMVRAESSDDPWDVVGLAVEAVDTYGDTVEVLVY